MKYFVILAFVAILGSLGTALFFMMKNNGAARKSGDRRMAWALALRVGLSIVLFASILLAWKLGYIHPSGIGPGQ